MKKWLLTILSGFCSIFAQNEPFALGADISWVPQRESEGVRYAHNGQVKDIVEILNDHGFNYIRLRLFVDPTATVPNQTCDGNWCPSPYSTRGYCGLDSTIKMAKRVKASGMKFLLDFHYSDTWADPGKQYKPVSWNGLSFAQLTAKVRSYTKESLEKFKENGVLPDMVQVGNEVVGGMIHDDGRNNSQNFAALVNAGINGVKDVDSGILIMMHTISERNPNAWLSTLKNNLNRVEAGAANKIDVIGLSYYPRWHGDLDSLGRILSAISNTHDIKIAVVEYADKHREVNELVYALPANKRFGTFVWEPQEFNGDNSLPLFDWSNTNRRRETNNRIAIYPELAQKFNPPGSSSSNVEISSSSSEFVMSSSESTDLTYSILNIGENQIQRTHNGIYLQSQSNAVIFIYDVRGNLIFKQEFKSGTHQISLSSLPKGLFIVHAQFNGREEKTLRINLQ